MTARAGLRVFAAGSLRPAFDLLVGAARDTLRIDYANARDLAQRLAGGEPADVFASASAEHPRRLRDAGLVDEPRPFASNRLVIAVPATSVARDWTVLAAPTTRVAIEVEGIPLGDYTRELLARLDALVGGDFSELTFANVIAQEQTVDAVAARLLAGDADAAVLYATDVAARGQLRAIELPEGAAVTVTCVACVIAASRARARASRWVEGLTDPSAIAIMRRAGFGPPRRPAPGWLPGSRPGSLPGSRPGPGPAAF